MNCLRKKGDKGIVLVTGSFLLINTNVAWPPVNPAGLECIGEALALNWKNIDFGLASLGVWACLALKV